ncbi:FISUMP domain-containing protein [Dysgonomonas sp. 25]|uniref:FISUMP domain-containing protein n=1 Tax=Dysgonomonas sp. 25 TaxID=2302933 RepID=UPI0013D2C4E5|nr:FISUMP domain-containing protein [Dysgonomonas sp. 25]NDV70060.1 hypothetical protein [Dysgonomonas sp. 25]
MKTILTQAIMLIALFTTTALQAQVTIGSNQAPNKGALLDLTQGSATTKGLALPRVALTDKDKLYPMLSSGYAVTEDAAHTGLIVYNTALSCDFGKGVHIWDGNEWQALRPLEPSELNLSKGYFDLPSGKDARSLTAQTLTVTWDDGLTPTWTAAASGGLSAVLFTGNPIPTLTNSPQSISLLPDAMTINASSPWASRQTDLTFSLCGQTKTAILNQTNYVLWALGKATNSQIIYTTTASGSIPVRSNATWQAVLSGAGTLATLTPSSGGTDLKDGSSPAAINTSYSAGTGSRYDYTDITFTDTKNPKRFHDVTVSVLNCGSTGNDPSMTAWAQRAGFTIAQINSISAGGTHATTQPNGIQLHKDQNGNIFLSGNFGATAGRWMLNNLAATSYASNVTHPYRTLTGPNYNSGMAYNTAYWGYPDANITTYNNNPRIGRIYTWDAATAGKGGSTGQVSITDGENIAGTPARVQGICPNGWHLPSDAEWTDLELAINSNTSQYSGIADANATITIGATDWRGKTANGHGKGMKDICPVPTLSTASDGASNIISSTVTPGMNILLVGLASNGLSFDYGNYSWFWTASSNTTTESWIRGFSRSATTVGRDKKRRFALYSVRCKKN